MQQNNFKENIFVLYFEDFIFKIRYKLSYLMSEGTFVLLLSSLCKRKILVHKVSFCKWLQHFSRSHLKFRRDFAALDMEGKKQKKLSFELRCNRKISNNCLCRCFRFFWHIRGFINEYDSHYWSDIMLIKL